jgi:hypothetical protein
MNEITENRNKAEDDLAFDELDNSIQKELNELHRQAMRKRLAASFEISAYFLVTSLFLFRQYSLTRYQAAGYDPILIFTSPDVLSGLAFCFVSIFAYLLTGTTPLVAVFSNLSAAKEIPGAFAEALARTAHLSVGASLGGISLNIDSRRRSRVDKKNDGDDIETNFASYITRSQDAARIAQRRPNALLFVGTIIAAAGLIFFVLTLPGSRYGFLALDSDKIENLHDAWLSAIQLLPRLLMLVFIQVLAGFFLRQYRSSMEDFRYYEAVLRHREAQYLSYLLRKNAANKNAMLNFSDLILKTTELGVLHKGQSTSSLEAHRLEKNDFNSLVEALSSAIPRNLKSPSSSNRKKGEDT